MTLAAFQIAVLGFMVLVLLARHELAEDLGGTAWALDHR